MVRPGLKLSVLITGTAFGVIACSDSGGDAADDGPSSSTTSGTTGGTITSGTTGGTTGGTTTSGTTGGTTTGGSTTSGTTGGTTTGGTTTGGTTTGGTTMGGTTMGTMMGAGGTSSGTEGTSTGAGGTGATTAEDFDPTAEDFTCIADWQPILRFRINNFLDHLDEAIAVAENPAGGVYPVGTILQHFPTEAMVKRRVGFSPETKDWEFFLLTLNQDGTTTIAERGTTDIMTMGNTCASCHATSDDQWDFVCNTYAEAGGGNCGFAPLGQQQLDSAIAMDPRCD